MFLFLSKIFFVFLVPANFIIALLIIRCFVTSNILKRRLRLASIIIFLLFSNKIIFDSIVNKWQPKPVDLTGKQFEAGILLGGISSYDNDTIGFFWEASDRFIQANKLYRQGIIKKIIISGGRIENDQPKEAFFLKQQLIQSGVREEDIIAEDQSKNTFENAVFTKKYIDSFKLKEPFVLITSAIHVARAQSVFEKAGIQVIPYPCHYKAINYKHDIADYFWPDIEVLNNWKFILKEWTGLVIYKLAGKA